MPVEQIISGLGDEGNSTKTIFYPSIKMSSYLFAWSIGEFEYVERIVGNMPLRVYTQPKQSSKLKFTLDVACKVVEFLSNNTQMALPLPKLDLMAIPNFIGGMKDFGLIMFHEYALFSQETDCLSDKRVNAILIAHEIAHQWFGDLVTCQWWDTIYLNEGFATLFGDYVIDKLYPCWKVWTEHFYPQIYLGALELDAKDNQTHPIEMSVRKADDAKFMFDFITYNKAAAVLRMVQKKIGEERFQIGIQNYLKKHSFSNVTSADLYQALVEISGLDELPIMMKQ
ncbi:MAG: putative Aminopeptidase M1-C [Streblomastix strix]|uniref:Putative Aminopeptidase M1-C n=1 Tax=Streblomastix strix TaxID=222440 RepID=A0A5J4W778_9EUKA|nr:MAG: putative Aminopeptidase M1-C [Streblomastix strix]